jgi:hypothetical protein
MAAAPPAEPARRRNDADDGPPADISVGAIKERGLREVRQEQRRFVSARASERRQRQQDALPPSHGVVACTQTFLAFYGGDLCHGMVVAAICYVSATLWLEGQGPALGAAARAAQDRRQADALRVLASLYCQLLLSPRSAALRVREERVFYETVIFFLDVCACFAIGTENPDAVYALLARVFRRDLQDPRVRPRPEFLPITEIVRRHWLSQRVPGKTRAEISRATLRGTTPLIEPLCQRELPATSRDAPAVFDVWDADGLPRNACVPVRAETLPRADILDLTPPKPPENPVAGVLASVDAQARKGE